MTRATKLLIPGLLCDGVVWQPLIEALSGNASVADLSTQDNLTDMAKDCLSAFEGPLLVAGHSMGARVAMEMVRLAPDRIERLALLDTGIHPLRDGEVEKRREVVRFAHERGMAELAERWLPGMVWEPNRQNDTLMKTLTDMVHRMNPDLHERQVTALVNRPDASQYLKEIACPVLLEVGRQDQWSPASQHEDMLRLLPDARLEIVENAGHFSLLEQPHKVASITADFLTSYS